MSFFKKTGEHLPASTIDGLRDMFTSSAMPDRVLRIAHRELETLSKISPSAAEYAIGLTYLEYLLSIPWNKKTEDNLDIGRAERILNERHYGLDRIKERILDHLAVKILIANKKPRILVVDDEEIARKNLEHILKKEDYVVVTAANGMEALEKMRTSDFDVIMTDLKMEKVSGVELLEKAGLRYPESKVIMITAYATVDSAVEAMKKGAFHYITKPFKLDEVRGTVREAVSKRTSTISSRRGSVLCFAGPPGTGKTSLGRAVADALGRKFTRISLGGIKDEAEIRGHRRTYAGAMPGRIIEEIRRSQVINPLIMLDEVDKIGQEFKGDSASALLEVLDPEQNHSFLDHYLDVPFDLSNVLFIVTANIPDDIQDPLRDRMEIMEFTGYAEDEKVKIALGYLVPRQIREQGLADYPPEFSADALLKIIQEHTREAGIRDLERQIATVCRKIASQFVHHKAVENITVTSEEVEKFLGPRKYFFEVADETGRIGVATGLVRTDVGGDIIFVEAAKMKGNKELILTGSLGNVMRESAQAALSYIRSNASFFHIRDDFFDTHDIHIHVPAGATPKDGPSAGATIAVALLSLLMGKQARRDVAISGELTLSGSILPVGGVKEKILAARRAGVKTVLFPLRNRADIDNLGVDVKKNLSIHLVDRIEEAVDLVLGNN